MFWGDTSLQYMVISTSCADIVGMLSIKKRGISSARASRVKTSTVEEELSGHEVEFPSWCRAKSKMQIWKFLQTLRQWCRYTKELATFMEKRATLGKYIERTAWWDWTDICGIVERLQLYVYAFKLLWRQCVHTCRLSVHIVCIGWHF